MNFQRVPDPQRSGETIFKSERTIHCPICGETGRMYGYIREVALQEAAKVRMELGMSEEEAMDELSLRMPPDAGFREVYPKGWYSFLLLPYKDLISDLDKVCVGHSLKPSDGFSVLQENEYKDYLKWFDKPECGEALVRKQVEENEHFARTMEADFIEQLMNKQNV